MRHDLRCPAKLHGVLINGDKLEIKCNSRFCGAGHGVVVLHLFDLSTGLVVETNRYTDPARKGRTR